MNIQCFFSISKHITLIGKPFIYQCSYALLYVKNVKRPIRKHSSFTTSFDNICCLNHIEPESDEISKKLKKIINHFVIHREGVNIEIHGFSGSINGYLDINKSKIHSTHLKG